MKERRVRIAAACLAVLLAPTVLARLDPQDESTGESEARTVDLTVEVRDEASGKRLAGAAVTVTGSVTRQSRSDTNGKATFAGLPEGEVRIDISLHGWENGSKTVALEGSAKVLSVEIKRLETELTINVRGDDDGTLRPISDCTVRIDQGGSPIDRPANSAGQVVVGGLARVRTKIRVIAPDWDTKVEQLTLEQERHVVEIVLTRQRPPDDDNE